MVITFDTDALREACNNDKVAKKKYGAPNQKQLRKRLDDLAAADTLAVIGTIGNCHELVANWAGHLALNLAGGTRLIFRPTQQPPPAKPDGGLDWTQVRAVTIAAIEDYHD